MEKFYCNICNKDVKLENGKCPNCGTDWKKIITEPDIDGEPILFYDNTNKNQKDNNKAYISNTLKNKSDDIKETYSFYLRTANIGKYIILLFATVIAIFSILLLESTDGFSLSILFIAFVLVGYAFVFEKNFKWKAYMLKLVYMNKNKK